MVATHRRPVRPAGVLLSVAFAVLAAASPGRAAPRWEPVPPAVLAATTPALDPDADAEALLWWVEVEDGAEADGLVSLRRHHVQVKVYTARGAQEWSKVDLDYPSHGVILSEVAGRTLLPDGTVLELGPKAVSRETIVKRRRTGTKRTTFVLPGVVPGAVVEYRFTEYRRDARAYGDFYPLQLSIPARRLVYRHRPLALPSVALRQLTFHCAARPGPRGRDDYYETTVTDQPAFREERDMPPRYQELAFAVSFYSPDDARTPAQYWHDVGREGADWFLDHSRPDDAVRRTAAELVSGAAGEGDRVLRIAAWVRANIRIPSYDDTLDAGERKAARDQDGAATFRRRSGNRREALLAFGSLLRAAGLQPRWVRLKPRSELFFHRNMLSEAFLDSYVVGVRLEGAWRTFDPTTEFLPCDMTEWDEEAILGLLCDRDSTTFIETSWSEPDRSTMARRADLELRDDGTLEGELRITVSGHLNAERRERFRDVAASDLDSLAAQVQTEDGSPLQFSKVKLENPRERDEPLRMTAHVRLPGFAAVTGKRILLEPSVFQARGGPRYPGKVRQHPVYFEHPWCELDTVVVRLPAGWRASPFENEPPLFAEQVADYVSDVAVLDEGRTVRMIRRFRMGIHGSIYFPTDSFAGIQDLFDGVRKRDELAIVLTRDPDRP